QLLRTYRRTTPRATAARFPTPRTATSGLAPSAALRTSSLMTARTRWTEPTPRRRSQAFQRRLQARPTANRHVFSASLFSFFRQRRGYAGTTLFVFHDNPAR